jgi:hypothetical protein
VELEGEKREKGKKKKKKKKKKTDRCIQSRRKQSTPPQHAPFRRPNLQKDRILFPSQPHLPWISLKRGIHALHHRNSTHLDAALSAPHLSTGRASYTARSSVLLTSSNFGPFARINLTGPAKCNTGHITSHHVEINGLNCWRGCERSRWSLYPPPTVSPNPHPCPYPSTSLRFASTTKYVRTLQMKLHP